MVLQERARAVEGVVAAWAGRVIETAIRRCLCACFDLERAPALGALVLVESPGGDIYGVVTDVRTEARDPGRRLIAHGGPADDRARIFADHPQIPTLLHTLVEVSVVGYEVPDGGVRQMLPPAPPPVYARLRACDEGERQRFGDRLEFLTLLLAGGAVMDPTIGACLRSLAAVRPEPRTFLVAAGRTLAGQLPADPVRLMALLEGIRP